MAKFTCSACQETFEEEWTEEEANGEAATLFGVKNASTNPDMLVVCDVCFQRAGLGRQENQVLLEEVRKHLRVSEMQRNVSAYFSNRSDRDQI